MRQLIIELGLIHLFFDVEIYRYAIARRHLISLIGFYLRLGEQTYLITCLKLLQIFLLKFLKLSICLFPQSWVYDGIGLARCSIIG